MQQLCRQSQQHIDNWKWRRQWCPIDGAFVTFLRSRSTSSRNPTNNNEIQRCHQRCCQRQYAVETLLHRHVNFRVIPSMASCIVCSCIFFVCRFVFVRFFSNYYSIAPMQTLWKWRFREMTYLILIVIFIPADTRHVQVAFCKHFTWSCFLCDSFTFCSLTPSRSLLRRGLSVANQPI